MEYMRDKEEWSGTATELLAAMGERGDLSTVITKWLNEYRSTFLSENGVQYDYKRKYNGRKITLTKCVGGWHDSHDRHDGSFGMPPRAVTADTNTDTVLSSEAESVG